MGGWYAWEWSETGIQAHPLLIDIMYFLETPSPCNLYQTLLPRPQSSWKESLILLAYLILIVLSHTGSSIPILSKALQDNGKDKDKIAEETHEHMTIIKAQFSVLSFRDV